MAEYLKPEIITSEIMKSTILNEDVANIITEYVCADYNPINNCDWKRVYVRVIVKYIKENDLSYMFAGATSFNQPLNTWVTNQVTNMSAMFWGAKVFNQQLNFVTSKVLDMYGMFAAATAFNQSLNFDTSSVTDMNTMFYKATAFDQDIGSWNISRTRPCC